MVSLSTIRVSNSLISSSLPSHLVAVFVGATSGIGETTLKQFAKHAHQPRAYFIGRSQPAADRILSECKALNPQGEYTFIKADVSLIRTVDDVCKQLAEKEKAVNILFLSQGIIDFSRTQTSEKLDLSLALAYYTRMRFIINLLPLLQAANSLRRVVTVFAGTKEGPIFTNDLQCANVSLFKIHSIRGHICSMIDFCLESIAKQAPSVGFIHDYPGFVKTNIFEKTPGFMAATIRTISKILPKNEDKYIPIDESGERHLYLATSARYQSGADKEASGVALSDGVTVARGSEGSVGSGVYVIDEHGESASPEAERLLSGMRSEGVREKVWEHTEGEFRRIAG